MKNDIDLVEFIHSDGTLEGFPHYPVRATQDQDNPAITTYERCLNGEPHDCWGLYVARRLETGAIEEEWIGDFIHEKDLIGLKTVLEDIVKLARNGWVQEDASFAGWIASDITERAEYNEMELSEAEEILKWMLTHCDAGQGVGIEEIDSCTIDYLKDKYSLPIIWGYDFDTILAARELHYFDRMDIIPRNHAVQLRQQGKNVWIVDTESGDAELLMQDKYTDEYVKALTEGASEHMLITQDHCGPVIGYQIVSKIDRMEYPKGSMHDVVYPKCIANAIRDKFNMPTDWIIIPVYEKDIANPKMITAE